MPVIMNASPYENVATKGSRTMAHRARLNALASPTLPGVDAALKAIYVGALQILPAGNSTTEEEFRRQFEARAEVLDKSLRIYENALNTEIGLATGTLEYDGVWDADTNTPALASGVGVKAHYRVVSVAGITNLDGISDWGVGDWVIFNGTAWQKIDNSETPVLSIMDSYTLDENAIAPLPIGVFNSWADLMTALGLYQNGRRVIVEIRSNVSVPAGTYSLQGVVFVTRANLTFQYEVRLFEAIFDNLESRGYIQWLNVNTVDPVLKAILTLVPYTLRVILRDGSTMEQDPAATVPFLSVNHSASATIDIGDRCAIRANGNAVEPVYNNGSLEIFARDDGIVEDGTIKASAGFAAYMIGPASFVSTVQPNALYPDLVVFRSTPRLDWDYVDVTADITLTPDTLDKVYGFFPSMQGGTIICYLPPVASCKNRRVCLKIAESGGEIKVIPDGADTIEGVAGSQGVSTGAGYEMWTLLSTGIEWIKVSKIV